jgi:hypothetical protein
MTPLQKHDMDVANENRRHTERLAELLAALNKARIGCQHPEGSWNFSAVAEGVFVKCGICGENLGWCHEISESAIEQLWAEIRKKFHPVGETKDG